MVMTTRMIERREWLEREFLLGDGVCVFNMLNPSIANNIINDPTVRRCIGFSRRLGAGLMIVVNLFTTRATNPDDLILDDDPTYGADIPLVRAMVACQKAQRLSSLSRYICAWGACPAWPEDLKKLRQKRIERTKELAKQYEIDLWCLGLTAKGDPCHPLYLRNDAALIRYEKV
jgi:hypothetical protein